jgi:tetratricopeptide (TPR) repeat protein
VEAPIIRTCRALIVAGLAVSAVPASATADEHAIAAYVRARAADSVGAYASAVEGYKAALALAPDDATLAARALDEGLEAGDRPLALTAAHALDRAGKLRIDGRLLLLGEALRNRDWRASDAQIAGIEQDDVFSFLVPLLRAWVAQGSRKGDPIALLDNLTDNPLARSYAGEEKALLLLASGKKKEGLAALQPVLAEAGLRGPRLRIAAASLLARKGDRAQALALLQGESEPLVAARARLGRGGKLKGEIGNPAQGVAELLIRIAADLNGQEVPILAMDFARLATFLAPENNEGWIVVSELLAANGQNDEALAALRNVEADDPFASMVADSRIGLLVAADRTPEALAEAKSEAEGAPRDPSGWKRLGDLLVQVRRYGEGADAYGKAVEIATASGDSDRQWQYLLLQGGAYTQGGRWGEGKTALEAAYRLAPDQPVVLNYLGYSQLERRENVAEAERMVSEAHRLQPDNSAITDSLGWAHFLRGDLPKAIELLETAARGEPADASIKEHLGDAYFKAGRRYEARYAWQAALVHADDDAAARLKAKVDAGLRPELAAP